jgi:hypothetical protein
MPPKSKPVTDKNLNAVWIILILAIFAAIVIFFCVDFLKGRQHCFDCGDGRRCTIDVRQFETKYSSYSLELEANIKNQGKLSTKLNPVQLQVLSEATQNANEFRKYVVSGFNACAITKSQYAELGQRYQSIDALAREINDLTEKSGRSSAENARLNDLINRFGNLATDLGKESTKPK